MSINLSKLPIVILRGVISIIIIPIGWAMIHWIVGSDLAKMAYATMSVPTVAMLSSGIPLLLLGLWLFYVVAPLFLGDNEEASGGIKQNLFSIGG